MNYRDDAVGCSLNQRKEGLLAELEVWDVGAASNL